MFEDAFSTQSKSSGSPVTSERKLSLTGQRFISSIQHSQCADQVFKKDIDVLYAGRFLGTWKTLLYEVERKYVPSITPGVQLYITIFNPRIETRASIMVVHGFGEHQGRYIQIADTFASKGYQVVLYDQRGHGRSGGIRCDTTVKYMHQDMGVVLQYVDSQLPTFCWAHALGATLVISMCQQNTHINFQGVITTNALFETPDNYNRPKMLLLTILNLVLPSLMINLYPNYSLASKNNYHMKKLAEDNLMQTFVTIRSAQEIIKLIQFVQPNASKFTTPLLLVHGKLDLIVSHLSGVNFYAKCGSKNKNLKIFEYGCHELHCDTEKDRLTQLGLDWCNKLIEQKKTFKMSNTIYYIYKIISRIYNMVQKMKQRKDKYVQYYFC